MGKNSLDSVLGDLIGMKYRADSTSILSEIRIPTFIVAGADDQIIPLSETLAMKDAIPKARLEIIPDAGHLPNLENYLVFNQVIRDFVSEEIPLYW